jgi:hypothetical protein
MILYFTAKMGSSKDCFYMLIWKDKAKSSEVIQTIPNLPFALNRPISTRNIFKYSSIKVVCNWET